MNDYERQQRQNNEAFRRQAEDRLHAQQQQQHRREMERQDEHWDARRRREQEGRADPGAGGGNTSRGMSPVVFYFGTMGALFGGLLRPTAMHWLFGAFFGFLIAGVAAGYMSESPRGRTILTIIGLLFAALVIGFIVLVIMVKDG